MVNAELKAETNPSMEPDVALRVGDDGSTVACSSTLKSLSPSLERYREKGFGIVVAALIAASYFYLFPKLLKRLWPHILSLSDEFTVYWLGTAVLNLAIFGFINLILMVISCSNIPFFERYRIQRHRPWQWNSDKPHTVARWKSLRWKAFLMLTFNNVIMGPSFGYFGYESAKAHGVRLDLASFPTWTTMMRQIFFFMIVDDTMFYWGHRFLHWKPIYPYIHKIHHSFYQPTAFASIYSHPIEIITTNVIPFMAGPLILGAHVATIWMWLILRIAETCDGHCGYEFSWSPYRLIPFSGSAAHHDFHHSHNKGNFGSFFTLWDKLCGTDQAFKKHVEEGRCAEPPAPFFIAWLQGVCAGDSAKLKGL
jgi:sterol desaturase/sphingolipid hydroxylase (fatty acid hydroxylase superfamily)